MVEVPKPDQELRFRNITLHGSGRREHGTLHLTRHHLLFSYYSNTQRASHSIDTNQNGQGSETQTHSRPSASTESSSLTDRSTQSTSTNSVSEADSLAAKSLTDGNAVDRKDERAKQKVKNIWIPYPLINHCILRPSHLPSQVAQPQDDSGHHPAEEHNELFPPTFGTPSFGRPSSDSARLAPYSSSPRPTSPVSQNIDTPTFSGSGRQPALRIRCRDFNMMALHFHSTHSGASPDETARQVFHVLRSRCCVDKIQDLHAFHFQPPREEATTSEIEYDARREYARMGISGKAAEGPGTAWRISDINHDYSYSATYPSVLCVPQTVSDNLLKYGGVFRSRCRIPCLVYLHSNGGSITRSSQPMVGVQNKRNPQDERLVSAIFSSHTTPLHSSEDLDSQLATSNSQSTTTLGLDHPESLELDDDTSGLPRSHSDTDLHEKADGNAAPVRKKVYGSTRRNLIVDARPRMNALANRATGGGIEDVANYAGSGDMPVEKVFLNIANIHVMRASLDKVFESFANSDYIQVKPNEETLRKSSWLGHIAGMLDGAEMIARVVGLGGSHVLIHCSDGWDRTAQVSALAQVMLDPHYRTLRGFISLIQKEFLSFGHKFRDRDGIEGSEKWFEIENERITPSRGRENNASDPNSLNNLGAKALTGAKTWFEKSRSNIFRQPNNSRDSLGDQSTSRPSSPPPNPILHSPTSATGKDEKEHKMSEKEISPIFHQFLDAVYQLQYQNPDAFEFNERFLQRLFFHIYSCQYGEFLFNTERERNRQRGKVASVWPYFLSRRQEFTHEGYVAKEDDPLLFPTRNGTDREVEVRWWESLFKRKDKEMNVPHALAPADPPAMTSTLGSSVSLDERVAAVESDDPVKPANGSIKRTKSSQSMGTMDVTKDFSSLALRTNDTKVAAATEVFQPQPDTAFEVLSSHEAIGQPPSGSSEESKSHVSIEGMAVEYDGDPLGVTASLSGKAQARELDFAAFASQNAFRDR